MTVHERLPEPLVRHYAGMMANMQAVMNAASTMTRNLVQSLGKSHDGNRDIYKIFGYPETLGGDAGFRAMYDYSQRQGIANRITYGMAKRCWRDGFELRSDPDNEESAQLVEELDTLRARGMLQKIERADILNRIGRFSILFVGVPDGKDADQELGRAPSSSLDRVYFQAYAYDSAQPIEWETDTKNPRFGMPTIWQLQRIQRRNNSKDVGRTTPVRVHYSRIVHIAENLLDSDIEGTGALEPVFNRILDLDKTLGGSAEAFFRNAQRVLGYEVDEKFASQVLTDPAMAEKFNESAQDFTNQWKNHMIAAGAKIQNLQANQISPLDSAKTILWEISSQTEIPLRVLTGEGGGQYKGSEDQLSYNAVIMDRQNVFCSPVVAKVLEILTAAGMLNYDSDWTTYFPPQQASTEEQEAEVNKTNASTFRETVTGLSTAAGSEIDTKSALEVMGLTGFTMVDIDDIDDDIDPDDDGDPENTPDPDDDTE